MSTPFATASLYVGDLRSDVTESQLFDIFKNVGTVASIRVCRDAISRRSLGYAYVNFHTVADAERALDTMNYTLILGKPCRIMWSHRDPSRRKMGAGNVFIKNLDKSVNNQQLYDTFSAFGNILSCKVETDDNGVSKGYGYVHFEKEEDAKTAVEKVNGMLIAGKKVFVGPFKSRKERSATEGHEKNFTNVYVKNLDPETTDEKLKDAFAKFGEITSAVVMHHPETGLSRGFGFVNFREHEAAERAVAEGNGMLVGTKNVVACRAQKKSERERELRRRFEQLKSEQPHAGQNVYVRNLDDSITDEELRTLFAPYGSITSAKVMIDPTSKISRGFGFVSFSTPEEAHKAISEVNGVLVHNKPLYVALAQKKEVRRQQLEMQHNQRIHSAFPPTMAPAYIHQAGPIFYAPGMMPPPPGQRYMFPTPQQGVMRGAPAGWRQGPGAIPAPGGAPHRGGAPYQQMAAYGMPQMGGMGRAPRQQGRRGISNPPMQMMAMQAMKPGDAATAAMAQPWRSYKINAAARNQQPFPGVAAPTAAAVPSAVVAAPVAAAAPVDATAATAPAATVAATVAAEAAPAAPIDYSTLSPEELRQTVGEQLFGVVYMQFPNQEQRCGKITGMLLESMEISELIKLLDDQQGLAKKIDEANTVYEAHQRKLADAQFASEASPATATSEQPQPSADASATTAPEQQSTTAQPQAQ